MDSMGQGLQAQKYGGLGLRKAGATNTTFIHELIWKFYNNLHNFCITSGLSDCEPNIAYHHSAPIIRKTN